MYPGVYLRVYPGKHIYTMVGIPQGGREAYTPWWVYLRVVGRRIYRVVYTSGCGRAVYTQGVVYLRVW